jgi:nucleoside-diphosphate-sugar epimerase
MAVTALVTGASGFLATQIIFLLLERGGYDIVAAVRSPEKVSACRQIYAKYESVGTSTLRFLVVPDMQQTGAYDEAIQGANIVFHTASPFHFRFEDNEKDMLIPAKKGVLSLLESASKASTVKRVVFTSSFAAITSPHLDPRPGWTYTEADWNPVTYEEAVSSQDRHFVYLASKTFAERALWDYVKNHDVQFDVTVLVPPIILGEAAQPYSSMEDINQSSRVLHRLLDVNQLPATPAYLCVDVKDCALCHVQAAEKPIAAGQRYLTAGASFSQEKARDIIASLFPEVISRLPASREVQPHYSYSSKKYACNH